MWTETGCVSMMVALLGFFIALEQMLPYMPHHAFSTSVAVVAVIKVFAS